MKTGLLTTLIAMIAFVPVIQAGWIECDLLQIKNDRLYFSVGEDDLVFQHSKYAIICDDDTLATGRIEESTIGVSYSNPIDSMPAMQDSCLALVETAEADSVSGVWVKLVGASSKALFQLYMPEDQGQRSGFEGVMCKVYGCRNGCTGCISPSWRGQTLYHESCSYDVAAAFHEGHFDGVERGALTSHAPFIAAMIPNLSIVSNEEGILTTSLYYRCGAPVLTHMSSGDDARSSESLWNNEGQTTRPYPFDPERGRQLLYQLSPRPESVTLQSTDPSLDGTAEYMADLLSRDKVRTEVTDAADADIQIVYVPINSDRPWSTLRAVHDLLAENEPRTRSQKEAMDLADAYINTAANSTDSATVMRFCKLAEQILIHDLGAFPLFRPTLFLYTSPSIRGLTFDKDGRLDISNMVKLKLPQPVEGDTE